MYRQALAILLAVFAVPVLARADVFTDVVDPYLRIQTALASDTLTSVKGDAARIAAGADQLGASGPDVRKSALALQSASDLAQAREAFGRLSDALIKYAESTRTSMGADLNVAYCPMEKKSWVQKGKTINNPYGGKQMQQCGEIVKPVR
jgi:hypothetical protein